MSRWTIYSKWKDQAGRAVAKEVVVDGNIDDAGRYALPELEYNGTWMGETFVTLNIRCSEPIDFEIGDYIVYRGEKFVMNYDPSVVKKARRGTYGEGFTYDNVKFNALNYELTDVRMLDYVIGDNGVHYSGLPTFQFFCSTVDDLCDRLQVNADRYCEENGIEETEWWVFVTPSETRTQQRCKTNAIKSRAAALYSTYFGDNMGDTASEKVNQNVSIDNMSVWDACKFIKETFGLNFISRERSIVVGAIGVPTEREFRYGLGNGLYEIERVADEDQAVITKLYAYGSDKNLPTRYYANIGVECYGYVVKWMQGEMKYLLLDIEYSGNYFTQKTTVNGQDCYAVRFTHGGVTYDAYVGSTDVIEGVTLSGFSVLFTDGESLPFDGQEQLTFIGGVNKDAWPTDNTTQIHKVIPQNLPNNMAVSHLMLPGFPSESLYSWVKNNGGTNCNDSTGLATWRGHTAYFSQDEERPYILSQYHTELGIREATKMFDGSDGTNEIYPTIENTEAGVIYAAETIKDNGVGTEMKNFTITLPDFGSDFDLKGLLQGDTAIEMTDGYCGGRSFNVKSVKKEDGRWVCTCEREHDTALDLWFPYSYNKSIGGQERADEPYQVRTGDRYVLTGIEMTSTYVEAAATVLLEEALKFLEANEYVRYTYVPRVDEIFMARQHDGVSSGDTATYGTRSYHDTLKEGDTLLFADDDLHITGSVFIDTLRIKEYGNGQIPTYELTLRNDKQVGTIERLQEQVNNISSTVNNGGGGGGGVNIPLVRKLIQSYGGGMFLSKTSDDTANGVITFVRGLRSKIMSVFEKGAQFGNFITGQMAGSGARIDERGKIEAQALTLREYLEVPELRFNRAEIIAGNTTQTPCGGIIDTVTVITEGDAETAGTGSATLKLEAGEIGKIAVGDLCMGYWHDMSGGNSETDSDDRHGRMAFSGFKTVYFRITSIPDNDPSGKSNWDKHYFVYTLRPQGSDAKWEGGNGIHPFAMMHFSGRGNATENAYSERKGFTIHTPIYTARLSGVDTWEFGKSNYTYVNGDLNGFGYLIDNPALNGFGTIDMNLYMKGHIIQVDNTPDELSVSQSMMGLLNKFDTQTVTFTVMDGYRQDHTAAYSFRVERNSGYPDADDIWASSHDDVGSSWTMGYADLGDADSCVFTVYATAADMPLLTASFLARKNNNLRYYLTLNTDLIHIDMNGEVIGNGNELSMTMGDVDANSNSSYLQLDGNYLTSGNNDNVYKIIARAWRVGAGNVVVADSNDGLIIRATKYTGNISEAGGSSSNGYLDVDVDFSCDKYIVELMDANTLGLVYDVKTVLIVRDGSASVVADFDDEMGAGAASSDGTMLAGLPYTSVAHLYRGSAVQNLTNVELVNVNGVEITNPMPSGWGYEETTEQGIITKKFYLPDSEDLALKGKDITVSLSYSEGGQEATLTLSKLSKESPDNNKFGVRLTAGSEANTAYFYFNKFKAGSDGHVTLYQLSPDVTAIKINKLGQHSATVVNVGVLKIDVDETGQTETNLTLANSGLICRYALDADITSSSSTTTGTIQCPNIEQKVSLRLEDANNVIWDTETIPVIRDGQDSNYVMKFAQSNIDIWADAEHTQLNPGWKDTFGAGYNWAIMSSDGGVSWNGPYPIVGEEGAPGAYTEFSFGISSYSITADTTTSPSDIGGENNPWHDGVVSVTTDKPYLWMRTGKFVWNATLNNGAGGHELGGDYTYARVKGIDAPDRYELELTDTSFQVDSNGNTFTPSEIKVQAVAVKANGSKDYKKTSDYQNSLVRVSMAFIATDDTSTSSTVSYGNLSFDGSTAIRIKQTLINLNKDITALKSVTLTFDFYKNASDSTAIGTATTTIPVMRNGRDGAIVTIADFDDEMISIPVKSDGSGAVWPTGGWQTKARLYYGTTALPLSSAVVVSDDDMQHNTPSITPSDSTGQPAAIITIAGFKSGETDVENKKLVLRLTSLDGQHTADCVAYVNKIPAGEGGDGKNAVIYNLNIDTTAIKKTGTSFTPASIGVTIIETDGDTTTEYAYDYFTPTKYGTSATKNMWIVYDADNKVVVNGGSTSGTTMSAATIPVSGALYMNVVLVRNINGTLTIIDSETIPIVRDGDKGDKGDPGEPGKDGTTPTVSISSDGYWVINGAKTAVKAEGQDGTTPTVQIIDGYWYINGSNTGVKAEGKDGKDGKDAASYEYVRFSDNATLVDGVWTGTFTAADATQVTNKGNVQENTKNLIPYSEFEAWNNNDNVPLGWMQHDNPETFMRQRDDDGVAWVRFSAIGGNTSKGFRLARDCDKDKGPLYLIPNTYGQTYNVSVRYKGNGRAMIVVHYWKWTSGTTTVSWLNTYAEYVYAEGYDDNKEHTITGTFTSRDSSATHFDIQLVHHYGMGSSSTTYEFAFAQPKVEIGSEATAYLPAPSEDLLGTTKGLWKGVMRWGHPYASSDFAQYEWNKVRDAEPRMNTWNSESYVVPLGAPTDLQYFYCGAYGEPYYDIVYDGAHYWICKQTYQRNIEFTDETTQEVRYVVPENTDLWSIYWEMASQFNFLMAKTLYAIDAYIEDLAVKKLKTVSEAGACVEIQDGVITLWADRDNSANKSRFEFGTIGSSDGTNGGMAVLRYYDKDGVQQYDLGPDGISTSLSSKDDVWTTKRLTRIDNQYTTSESPYATGYIVSIRTSSENTGTYYELTSEGYAMLGNVKTYHYSGETQSGEFEGHTYMAKFTSLPASSYIPDGWYRAENTSGNTFASEETLDDGHGTTMTATVYSFQTWYYANGKVTRFKLVQLELLSDGTGMVTN